MVRKLVKGGKVVLTWLFLSTIIVAVTVPFSFAVTWSEHEIRLTTSQSFDGIPSITQTRGGRIWIVWTKSVKGNFSIVYQTSSDGGKSWSAETVLTSDPSIDSAPSIFQTMDDTIWLVWQSDRDPSGGYDLYYKTSSDGGVNWSNATRLTTDSGDDTSAAITQTGNGTIWVVWASDRTGGYDLYYKTSSDGGVNWSNATRLTTDPYADKLPSITQTSDGAVWISWCSDRTEEFEIYCKTYDGLSWSNDTQLTTDPGQVDTDPAILETVDETIWIFWPSRGTGPSAQTDDLYYMYSCDNGATWSDRILFTKDVCQDTWPVATQTSDTEIWVVWTSDRADQPDGNWDIYYRASLAGDVNEDGVVDLYDLNQAGHAYGAVVGEPEYDLDADINKDDRVDMRDLSIVCKNYGAT